MSLKRKVAHNTLVQFGGKGISTILGLVAIAMMTRYLGTEQFGWYVTTISFLQFIAIMIDFGLTPVTNQLLADPKYKQETIFQNLLGFRLTTAFIFLGIAPLIALFFPYPVPVKFAIALVSIQFLGVAINQILIGLYQTKLKMHIQVFGELIGRVILVGGIWGLMVYGATFLPVMGIITISGLAYTLFLWINARNEITVGFKFDFKVWKVIIKKSWPITISIIFNVVYLRGDILLLSLFRDQIDVGVYGAAYRVLDVITATAMMVMGVLMPLLAYSWSRKLTEQFHHRFKNSYFVMMAFAVPMTVGGIMLAKPIMALVAGPEFAGAVLPLQILTIAVLGVYFGALFGHTAVAIDKQKQTIWIYCSSAIITLIGYLIFIPRFGMIGAAWMTVFSEVYVGILLWLTIRHLAKIKIPILITLKILVASAAMAISLFLLQTLPLLLLIAIGALVYFVVLYAIGGISKELLKEILSRKKV